MGRCAPCVLCGCLTSVKGVCPQFDVVWDDLTVREHLLVFARLKGVEKAAEPAVIQQIAESVELDGDAFNQTASQLSGGMRRRLSIGISLIGRPKVWLLDECTTGLDPSTKRDIWKIVGRQRTPERAVILTTVRTDG
jgi:ABC-type multidrug transport system ATPase subunit